MRFLPIRSLYEVERSEEGMNNWCLEVWGDYACFTRPEMKVERVSYDVMTPSAARAIFEAILWKPAIKWNVTQIEVLNPIQWISVRRNEVRKKIPRPTNRQMSGEVVPPLGMFIEEERQLRAGLFLRDVRYRIHGYFDYIGPREDHRSGSGSQELWADKEESEKARNASESAGKYAAMFERRAKKGQCFHRPYLGCREFACFFKLVEPNQEVDAPIAVTKDLGFMLYDLDFADPNDPSPMFFRAQMNEGTINTDAREIEVIR